MASSEYRDGTLALTERIAGLEAQLAEVEGEAAALRARLGEQEPVMRALRRAASSSKPRYARGVGVLAGASVAAALLVLGGRKMAMGAAMDAAMDARAGTSAGAGAGAHVAPRPALVAAGGAPVTAMPTAMPAEPCARLGVRVNLAGTDAEAPWRDEGDLAGHKYRRGGDRSPWLTVHGAQGHTPTGLYVHAVGGYLAGDVGTTNLALLTIASAGDAGGYRLADGGRSLLEVQGVDEGRVWGRFEADVSKVADTTRAAPFGADVLRVRGSFCLPRSRPNPADTAP